MRKMHWPKMTLFNAARYFPRAPDKIFFFFFLKDVAALKIVWVFIPRNVISQL